MRKGLIILTLLIGGCLWSGCIVLPKGDSSAGVRTTNSLEFFHQAPDEGAEFRVDVLPWIQEEIKARREAGMLLDMTKDDVGDGD